MIIKIFALYRGIINVDICILSPLFLRLCFAIILVIHVTKLTLNMSYYIFVVVEYLAISILRYVE